jgi:hypothetical protein
MDLTRASYEYTAQDRHGLCVKVTDIFGNDTTKVVEVRV